MKVKASMEEQAAKEAFDAALGEYLRDARIRAKKSQPEIAKAAKLSSAQFISNIERGLCAVPPYILRVMIREYGINMSTFLEFLADAKMAYYKKILSAPRKSASSRNR